MEKEKRDIEKREYKRISDQERVNLIFLVESANFSVSRAASMLGLRYANAMSIMRVYRKENRMQSNRPVQASSLNNNNSLFKEGRDLFASLDDRQSSLLQTIRG